MTTVPSTHLLTCQNIEGAIFHVPIYASKPTKTDYLLTVLRPHHSVFTPFVVHTYNKTDGGFYHGHYFTDYADALAYFNSK